MLTQLFERWGLNPREQRVASIAVMVLGVFVLLAIPVGLSSLVASRTADNDELKETLSTVNGARAKIRERRDRKNAIVTRYAKKTPQLGGFLEQQASTAKVQIADSQDHKDAPHGKQYVERYTVVHLKNGGMGPIAHFLEGIENSGYPISVTRLNIRKRAGEPDSYGPVEVGVSTFDRNAPAPAAAGSAAAGDKGTK